MKLFICLLLTFSVVSSLKAPDTHVKEKKEAKTVDQKPKREAYTYLPNRYTGNVAHDGHSSQAIAFDFPSSDGLQYGFSEFSSGGSLSHPKVETYIIKTEPGHNGKPGAVYKVFATDPNIVASTFGHNDFSQSISSLSSTAHSGQAAASFGGSGVGGHHQGSTGFSGTGTGTEHAGLSHSNGGNHGSSNIDSSAPGNYNHGEKEHTQKFAVEVVSKPIPKGGINHAPGVGTGNGYSYTQGQRNVQHAFNNGGGGSALKHNGFAGNSGPSSFSGYQYNQPSNAGVSGGGQGVGHYHNSPTLTFISQSNGPSFSSEETHDHLSASISALASSFGKVNIHGHNQVHSGPTGYNYDIPSATITHVSPANANAGAAGHTETHTPIYAQGHKGLSHFSSPTPSKAQTLKTDFISSNKYDASKAAFKPSNFLGNINEDGSLSAHSSGNSEYSRTGSYATQYLPPTSGNYEYQTPTTYLIQKTQYAAPVHEPEALHLPPTTHFPRQRYLPPQH